MSSHPALCTESPRFLQDRLHLYGYAQWPTDEVRLAAFAEDLDPDASEYMSTAIAERFPSITLNPSRTIWSRSPSGLDRCPKEANCLPVQKVFVSGCGL